MPKLRAIFDLPWQEPRLKQVPAGQLAPRATREQLRLARRMGKLMHNATVVKILQFYRYSSSCYAMLRFWATHGTFQLGR